MSTQAQGSSKTREQGERNRLQILRALAESKGGKATTTDIKQAEGIETGTTNYHCEIMEEQRDPSLVKLDGKERIDNDVLNDPNRWRITEHGRQVVETLEDDQLSIEEAASFVELRTELSRTQERLEKVEKAHDDFVKKVQQMVQQGEIEQILDADPIGET